MVSYAPLWKLLIDKKMRKGYLGELADISRSTMAKMGRDEYVALEVIERICLALDCQPSDIFTILPSE